MSGIDLKALRSLALRQREARVPVPEITALAAHLGLEVGPEGLVWTVRGLTGEEVARVNDLNSRPEVIAAAAEVLAGRAGSQSQTADAMRGLLGLSADTPLDLAQRFDRLVFGSVDVAVERSDCVWLFHHFPALGYRLTNKILELTGAGSDVAKPPHSTPTPESA